MADDGIGTPMGMSRWLKGEPRTLRTPVIPVMVRWLCPAEGCDGEMRPNGFVWSTSPPGIHHTCDKCGFTAATDRGRYPRIEYDDPPARKIEG